MKFVVGTVVRAPARVRIVHTIECPRTKTIFGARHVSENKHFVVAFADLRDAKLFYTVVSENAVFDGRSAILENTAGHDKFDSRTDDDVMRIVRPTALLPLLRRCASAGVGVLVCEGIDPLHDDISLLSRHVAAPVAHSQIVKHVRECFEL